MRGYLGALLLFWAVGDLLWTGHFVFSAESTSATITGIHKKVRKKKLKTSYRPIVTFTVDGQIHKFTSMTSTSWEPNVGEEVKILYPKGHPENARINGLSLYFLPLILGFMSAMLLWLPRVIMKTAKP